MPRVCNSRGHGESAADLQGIQVKGARNQSKVVSTVSYFPFVIYLVTLISESIYLLARGYVINGQPPLGALPWSLWFVALVVFLVAIITFSCVLPNVEMQLDVKEHVIFDFIGFIVLICFGALYYLISKATHGIFLKDHNADNIICWNKAKVST